MVIIPQEIINYAEKNSEDEPLILQNLRKETWRKVLSPRMLSGHLQGRLLAMISKIVQPKNILEIGTYTGYATICLSEGLAENGSIHTIDNNEELVDFQRKHFNLTNFSTQITQHTGNAIDIISQLTQSFDLVFIDADKTNYSQYFDLIIDKTNTGGIILTDNVLWGGKVIEKIKKNDFDSQAIYDYNLKINMDKRVETILLPFRDGISITRKL